MSPVVYQATHNPPAYTIVGPPGINPSPPYLHTGPVQQAHIQQPYHNVMVLTGFAYPPVYNRLAQPIAYVPALNKAHPTFATVHTVAQPEPIRPNANLGQATTLPHAFTASTLQLGKHMRLPFVSSSTSVTSLFDIIHSDV
ncbi:hypothetical protein Tco_1286922 [Tanacetum coccineum]